MKESTKCGVGQWNIKYVVYALKGLLIIVQGNALGTDVGVNLRPERAT
jgi:hypothetical protein